MFKKILFVLCLFFIFPFGLKCQQVVKMERHNGVYFLEGKLNGLPLVFILDTGASNISISIVELLFMIKNGYLDIDNIKGVSYYKIANGEILEGTTVLIDNIEIGGIVFQNLEAQVSHNIEAPLLLGQNVLSKFGKIQIDFKNDLLIIQKEDYVEKQIFIEKPIQVNVENQRKWLNDKIEIAAKRFQFDVNLSHIMLRLEQDSNPQNISQVYSLAYEIERLIRSGNDFGQLALQYSGDRSVTSNLGNIGWVTAFFPKGFQELEDAAYNTQIGELSIVRSQFGIHIVKINAKREAFGEMTASHILVTCCNVTTEYEANEKINLAYNKLKGGEPFSQVAKEFSEDRFTSRNGGLIGTFGINKFEKKFEETAFALKADGDYSMPIRTSIGFHIIQRISRTKYNYEDAIIKAKNILKE